MPAIRNGRGELSEVVIPLVNNPPGPIELVTRARPDLPCPGCAHVSVCAIAPKLDASKLELVAPPTPDPAIRLGLALTLVCKHFLAAIVPMTSDKLSAAEYEARSRRRGAEAHRAVAAAAKASREAPPATPAGSNGHIGAKRSPEARERMRQAQKAAWERRHAREAAAAGSTD